MKRVLLAVTMMTVAMVMSTSVFGQERAGFVFGGKIGPGFGINKLKGDIKDLVDGVNDMLSEYGGGGSLDDKSRVSFSLDLYGGYAFNERVSLVGELNFMFGQGIKIEGSGAASGYDVELKYSSLDIPVLLRYAFINRPVVFGLQAGPYLSIPFGLEISGFSKIPSGTGVSNMDGDYDSAGALGGITVGAFFGYPLGPGKIVGDLRFLADLANVKADVSGSDWTALHRAGINLTVGYEF